MFRDKTRLIVCFFSAGKQVCPLCGVYSVPSCYYSFPGSSSSSSRRRVCYFFLNVPGGLWRPDRGTGTTAKSKAGLVREPIQTQKSPSPKTGVVQLFGWLCLDAASRNEQVPYGIRRVVLPWKMRRHAQNAGVPLWGGGKGGPIPGHSSARQFSQQQTTAATVLQAMKATDGVHGRKVSGLPSQVGRGSRPGSIHPPKTGSLAAWTTCRLPFSHGGSTIGWVSNYLFFSCGTHHLAYLDVVIWHGNLVPIQRRSLCARETRCSHHLSRRASDPSCRWRGTSCASSTVPPRQRRTHDGRIEPTSSSLHGPGLLTKWATQASLSTPERGSPDEIPYVSSYLVRPAALLPAPASPVRAPPFPTTLPGGGQASPLPAQAVLQTYM